NHLWEIDIRNTLIAKEDGNLIRDIFPKFSDRTLTDVQVFYPLISDGKLKLIKALVEGGMSLRGYFMVDLLLYALTNKQREVADFFLTLPEYDINGVYPLTLSNNDPYGFCAYDMATPAYLAVYMNDPDLLKWLIDKGADCSVCNQRPKDCDKYRNS